MLLNTEDKLFVVKKDFGAWVYPMGIYQGNEYSALEEYAQGKGFSDFTEMINAHIDEEELSNDKDFTDKEREDLFQLYASYYHVEEVTL